MACGSVDEQQEHLLGRMLYDQSVLADDAVEALEARRGKKTSRGASDKLDFSLLADGLMARA